MTALLLFAWFAAEPIVLPPTVPTVTSTSVYVGAKVDPDTICERSDGTGDLEPCAWQELAKRVADAAAKEETDKLECRAKDCRVHHFSDCTWDPVGWGTCHTLYRGPNTRMWYCDCDWKPKPLKRGAR